jgi:hypothetical protein
LRGVAIGDRDKEGGGSEGERSHGRLWAADPGGERGEHRRGASPAGHKATARGPCGWEDQAGAAGKPREPLRASSRRM